MGACCDKRSNEERDHRGGTKRRGLSAQQWSREYREDRHPIERETDQQQNDVTTTDNVPARSLTCEGNQYAEGERDRVCDTGMVIDVQRGSMEELGFNDMEQDPVSKTSHKQDVDRDIDKTGRKRHGREHGVKRGLKPLNDHR